MRTLLALWQVAFTILPFCDAVSEISPLSNQTLPHYRVELKPSSSLLASSEYTWNYAVATAIILHFLLIVAIGLLRHWALLTSINDLGAFDQATWGAWKGTLFNNTINATDEPISWLGFHFNPILGLFVPFYAITPAAEWLIVAQCIALSVTAWPLYRISMRILGSSKASFFWVLSYLLNPFVIAAAVWDFHPVTLAVPMLTLAFCSIEARQHRLFFLMCALLTLVQEQMGLTVIGLGLLWGIRNKSFLFSALVVLLGLASAYAVLGMIMPALSPTGNHPMLNSNMGQLSRYNWLGHSLADILSNLLRHPLLILDAVFLKAGGWQYWFQLFVYYLFLPVAAPAFLLPALADLAANTLSANGLPRSTGSYHSVTLVPILLVAALHGSKRILPRLPRLTSIELASLVALAAFFGGYRLAPLPLPGALNFWAPAVVNFHRPPEVAQIKALIGPDAVVSAQANIGAHFSQRARLYRFPERTDIADTIILHMESPTTRLGSPEVTEVGTLSFHLQMPPDEYLDALEKILVDSRHEIIFWSNSWLVLRRSAGTSAAAELAEVKARIAKLRDEWPSSQRTP